MNINLISPIDGLVKNYDDKTNGHRYTIRFKEDIIIPANSKLQLNFATLTRQSEISFIEDQILYINVPALLPYTDSDGPQTYTNILPTHHLDSPGANTLGTINYDGDPTKTSAGNKYEVAIPKGFYTFERFYKVISDGINGAISFKADGTTPTTTNNDNYRAAEIVDTNATSQQSFNKVDLTEAAVISIAVLENIEFSVSRAFAIENINQYDFEINDTHRKNAGVLDSGGLACVYVKNNTDTPDPTAPAGATGQLIFDSYAMGKVNFRHTGLNDNTPYENCNVMDVKTNKTWQNFADNPCSVAFGLGSQEVANGLEDTDGTFPLNDVNRTRGENPTTAYPVQQSFFKYDNTTSAPKDDGLSAKRKIPAAFLTCVITSEQDANGRGGETLC